ncbi:TVP38/TMEM64 family protein [Enterococcus xiangfangensis]|uniref:TVP38/TMEM64 family protein n=1 Tax=Enterococcus xiangfangensis TaxID=1296537 RepID=UPI0010F66F5A|nr:TVP38/TMEM64 family protein [Enterococcus xiangfangensis]MBM7712142.1 putative membrane protein YdjX (TVP38/TMEM64 family) [Enterococcus xiangfangensis]
MAKINKRTLARILLVVAILMAVLGFYFVPAFRSKLTQVMMLFRSMSVESIIGYLRSFGVWAVVISFLLMMFQSVIAPLPAFLITFANAAVFGWWQGALLSWVSAMAGALLCFYIARIAGRDIVEKMNKNFSLEKLDEYFDRYGKHTILICRLLPFISFDFISYAAGLTAIKPLPFLITTGIGQLPATIVYSYVGSNLTGSTKTIMFVLLSMFALFIAIYVFKQIYQNRQVKTNK